MRQWIDLVENRTARSTEGLFNSRKELLDAIFKHCREQIDSDMRKYEFMAQYQELMSELKFPLKIYRGMSAKHNGENIDFDAHHDELEGHWEQDAVSRWIREIDFKRVGCYWTWDRDCAVYGGTLEQIAMGEANVIIEATVQARQVDLPMTIYQNLTVYQEEKEVRLLANTPITITGIYPNPGIRTPIRANTGPESWDNRSSSLDDLRRVS